MKYVYKIVAALGALSVLPLFVFIQTVYFKISSAALSLVFYLGQMSGNEKFTEILKETGGNVPTAIADDFSLYDILSLLGDISADAGNTLDGKFDALIVPVATTGVILALIAICSIVTAVLAFVAKDNRKVIFSSIAGIGLCFMYMEAFEGIAAPILDGKISIATIMESVWGGLIGNIEALNLNSAFWFIPMVFGGIILWTVLYNYTLPEKEKKERKLMLGEADDE